MKKKKTKSKCGDGLSCQAKLKEELRNGPQILGSTTRGFIGYRKRGSACCRALVLGGTPSSRFTNTLFISLVTSFIYLVLITMEPARVVEAASPLATQSTRMVEAASPLATQSTRVVEAASPLATQSTRLVEAASPLATQSTRVIEPVGPLVYRRSALTNSAAEFVERGRGMEVLVQAEEDLSGRTEFIEEIDQFADKGLVFDAKKYYEASEKSFIRFRQTLQRLVTLLQERGVDKELGIDIKDPGDGFTFDYVLGIANRLQEGRENALQMNTCKTFIRRCYRKVEDSRGVIGGILEMVPNDAYGSVISGGFTLILAAVEKHAKEREAIQKWLTTIPETLEGIERLSKLHRKSPQLHQCANNVLVAVFFVLERIVDRLTQSWKDRIGITAKRTEKVKGLFKKSTAVAQHTGAQHTGGGVDAKKSVDDALSELKVEIERFQKAVDICGQERLGRIEDETLAVAKRVMTMSHSLAKIERFVEGQQILRPKEDDEKEADQKVLLQLQNIFYQLCASNPHFDSRTGGIDHQELQRSGTQKSISSRSHHDENMATRARWLASSPAPRPAHVKDIRELMDRQTLLTPDDQDVSTWIVNSDELFKWSRDSQSRVMTIDLPTPPRELVNPLSFSTAKLATAFLASESLPVLCFFCMHRNSENSAEEHSGPLAMVNAFNHDLIKYITQRCETVDLAELEELGDVKACKKSRTKLRHALALFRALIGSLPGDQHVYVLIDCLSYLSGDEKDGKRVMGEILEATGERDGAVIKLLVTDPGAGSSVRRATDYEVMVPDNVPGSGVFSSTKRLVG
ncbi:hypothetical protein QBC47DRAFT_392885 [Echria macrotheca]|uniref:Uncharacterized protein n=1 Tax=Echria macrotheca TaxID=438768 RepID=A0AAJ0F780_9PEZI|nr:hypothetical protein QBC47DRAFT_392885 [Echria macrotheca]